MPSKIILAPTLSARSAPTTNDADFVVTKSTPVTVQASALAGVEVCDIYFRANEDVAWTLSGITLEAGTAGEAVKRIVGEGEYFITKDVTASTCGIYAIWS